MRELKIATLFQWAIERKQDDDMPLSPWEGFKLPIDFTQCSESLVLAWCLFDRAIARWLRRPCDRRTVASFGMPSAVEQPHEDALEEESDNVSHLVPRQCGTLAESRIFQGPCISREFSLIHRTKSWATFYRTFDRDDKSPSAGST